MVFAEHSQVKGYILLYSVEFQHLVNGLQPLYGGQGSAVMYTFPGFLQRVDGTEQVRRLQQGTPVGLGHFLSVQKFFRREIIFSGNIFPKLFFCLRVQSRLLADALEIFHLANADLKLLQSCILQRLDDQADHLSVGLHAVIPYQFGPDLGDFLQLALKA